MKKLVKNTVAKARAKKAPSNTVQALPAVESTSVLTPQPETLFFPTPPEGSFYVNPGVFTDDRGTILRLTDKSVGGVQLITTKAGARRASHWHREDGHLCTVVSGRIDYYERPVGADLHPKMDVKHSSFSPGESFFTGPNMEHEMHFPEDTVFICMSNKHRTPEEYEKDLVRLQVPLLVK